MAEDRVESAEEAAYRAKVRAWLAENAAEYRDPPLFSDAEAVRRASEWQHRKWENGYVAIATPEAAGGVGGTPQQAQIFAEEERRYKVPRNLGPGTGLAMVALLRHGAPEQILKWGTLINSGQAFISQLFSEPGAGSDLAGLRTRAVRQGDNWIVNGQKVWSSWAHHANYGILIARTDPSLPKHKGLSFFIIDMRQPGVTVRPIRQITGHSDFNETFLVDAVVPDENRIGAEGEGWAVTMTVLGAERNGIGSGVGGGAASPTGSRNLIRLAQNAVRENGSALDNAAIRAKIADWHVQEQGLKNFGARLQEELKGGGPQPANMPIMKLTTATMGQQIHAFMMDLDEYGGVVQDPDAPEGEDRFYSYLYSAVYRIAGGADQVLRNQLSERALGMPGDMRMDRDVPFESLPV